VLDFAAMIRRTLLLASTLALALTPACRETPPAGATTGGPAPAATTAAPALATATATATATASASASAAPVAQTRTWSFDKDKADEPPAGFEFFKTGGKAGKWIVKSDPSAPSAPNVLAQLDGDKTDGRFATAIAAEAPVRDARVSVRCKPISGKVDQSCGVVVRFKDEKNYYLARANALEKDVNLYVVKDGKRASLGGWKGANFGDAWHEIRLEARGDHLELSWDGTRVFEARDTTHPEAGRVGVWIKADSVTHFDELALTPL
jgi:hypothetical protein